MSADGQKDLASSEDAWISVAAALSSLGYRPESGLRDAAVRMLRTPELAEDLLAFAKMEGGGEHRKSETPGCLLRRLPGGYTVESLIGDFRLRPTGAFLIASELLADTGKAQAVLARLVHEGAVETRPDGTRILVFPPIRNRLKPCPECGVPLFPVGQPCHKCGGASPSDGGDALTLQDVEDFIGLLEEPEKTAAPGCLACGAPLHPGALFCGECGARVEHPIEAPHTCRSCGATLSADAKFCGECGSPVDG